MRSKEERGEVKLKAYEKLKKPHNLDERPFKKILYGISCRRYEEVAKAIPEVFGLSASTISKRYVKLGAKKFEELQNRCLDKYDIVAILIDGKTFKDDERRNDSSFGNHNRG